ncbi:hypothetical protein BD413DRAFT_605166 [Trametes elegans]|nr:hypothetical protein BD413DRAFT_605166 [Trametes elegans]
MPPPPLPPQTPSETAPTATGPPLSTLHTLQNHIQTLSDLNNRLQALRHIPALLLRPPATEVHALPQAARLRHEFQEVQEIAESVRSEHVQEALQAARKSEIADPTSLGSGLRRENLKRRRPPSPESPQPYRPTEPRSNSSLTHEHADALPMRLDGLPVFVRDHNKSSPHKLHVVALKRGRPLECPVVLRFVIQDVLTVYLKLDRSGTEEQNLVVESATAFGPREQKPVHSQSDYTVYQQLSQELAKVLRAEPWAPLRGFVSLLSAYENLFTEPCSVCGRVLSADVHTPPVVRVLRAPRPDSRSEWDVHHTACKWQ